METWFAVVTKPRSEVLAHEHLVRQGYECLLPQVRRMLRNAAGLRSRVESLFPNYLFLRADPDSTSLAPVRSTRGAIGLVRFGGEPVAVPDAVIDRIKGRISDEDGLVRLAAPELCPGQAVRLLDGPLSGWDAVFVADVGDDRVRLLLQLLGSCREIVVPRAQLGMRI